MSKQDLLEIIKLLSALESWAFSLSRPLPDHLLESISSSTNKLAIEVLKGE